MVDAHRVRAVLMALAPIKSRLAVESVNNSSAPGLRMVNGTSRHNSAAPPEPAGMPSTDAPTHVGSCPARSVCAHLVLPYVIAAVRICVAPANTTAGAARGHRCGQQRALPTLWCTCIVKRRPP
jgi:hypothetical protein